MRLIELICTAAFCVVFAAPVSAAHHFIEKFSLQTGQTVVVAEGELEARSIGSFTITLYRAAQPVNETTFYQAGMVLDRDGAIEQVALEDLDQDGNEEVIVIIRSAGSGGYLSAKAIKIAGDELSVIRSAEGLAWDADPINALRSLAAEC